MKIRLLAFGAAREIVGHSVSQQEIMQGASVGYFLSELKIRYPGLSKLRSLTIAVNGTYAAQDVILSETDEVALIPPVSGG
ncbi:MAG: MoaD/ThiS family protein [Taibaiella sp.]|nr:MoaD/ThiS family protein [Taibaiella sp.]